MSKTAPPQSVRSQKKTPKKKQRWWQWPWFVSRWSKIALASSIFVFGILAIVLMSAYLNFSRMIDRKLSGEIFQNTARVYSAPLTVFRARAIRRGVITDHLKKARYSEKGKGSSSRVGEYSDLKRSLEIIPQEDSFYGASGGRVRIDFDEKSVVRIISLPDQNPLDSYEIEPLLITNLFDKNREKRRLIKYDDVPKVLRDAVISIEDRRFFEHAGFDPVGIVRAAFVDMLRWERAQGASTITQQVVRNFWLSPERRIIRKLKEIYMSIILETRLSKQQIFTLYANDAYLGQRGSFSINGFGEAATAYFNKDIKSLTIPDAALIAGIIQSPNRYNPVRHAERALQRRNLVLQAMLETGCISKTQYNLAVSTPLNLAPVSMDASDAPYFVDLVKDRMLDKYSEKELLSQQYRIFTTLDLELQRIAYHAVREGAENVDTILAKRRQRKVKRKKGEAPPPLVIIPKDRVQACLIALDPHSGEIRALVGGRDYGASQLNRVTTAKRQPGSIFKSFVFATSLNSGLLEGASPVMTAATIVDDSPTVFEFDDKTYEPNNYGEKFYGPVTLRRTLTKSLNVATVKFAEMTGLEKIVALAKQAGMNEKLMATPALALGAYEVTPLEIAGAYTIFANAGVKAEPSFVRSVKDSKGRSFEIAEPKLKPVLDPRIAYLMTNLMEGVINHGTGARARGMGFTPPAAGKTGTSHDGWFAGYTSGLLCIVWVGFDDNRELNLDGATSALPIWTEFMKKATTAQPWLANAPFLPPAEGITAVMIDANTGLLASSDCQDVIQENYLSGTEPQQSCSLTAHEWLLNLREAPADVSSQQPSPEEPGKNSPLVPPAKQPNALKRFFSKIF
ncbi:MAG: PBP1A family penicillin-binding protein [Acidobacteria bacterium]|nr:PBP1A family penicillin-binding protein [Acidobacteriota bacterium]MCI0721566.1 PBP1A family penicillin-binding protein [Acidobacteriota bacterium]